MKSRLAAAFAALVFSAFAVAPGTVVHERPVVPPL